MRRIRAGWWAAWVVLALGIDARGAVTTVTGRVVGPDGAPASGADVASLWSFVDGRFASFSGVTADAAGRFTIEKDFRGRPGPLLAMNAARTAGGWLGVDPAKVPEGVEIRLGPLVRVRGDFSCTQLGKLPGGTTVMLLTEDKQRLIQSASKRGTFDFRLPAGKYRLVGFGSDDLAQISRPLELSADRPDLDLGTIDFPASPIGRMYGKPAPELHVTDARGIGKDMKLADLKGKWVLLDFWGYWCGPCVGDSLPDLMQLWDEYPNDRDKFAILAFHDPKAGDLAELDRKLAPIVRGTWGGRELPFPILLDATGKTVEEYGIHSWPTTILIDPTGKVVRGSAATLREHLPAIPMARRVPLALDRQVRVGFSGRSKLDEFVKSLGREVHLPIQLDDRALATAGVDPAAPIVLLMSGQASLRSWLELGLQPLGLVAVPGPAGLIVTAPTSSAPLHPEPSATQRRVAARIAGKLDAPATFDFRAASLDEVIDHLGEQAEETFVLDPADRLAGRIDPQATVSGRADGVPLRDGLRVLLGPLGIEAVVRHEVIVLGRPARP